MLQHTGIVDDLNVSLQERFRAALAGVFFVVLLAVPSGWLPWWTIVVLAGVVVWANHRLFALFYQRKGLLFAIMGIAFHQLYYLYSSAAFIYCWLESKLKS
jgi:hypothetical protein